MVLFILHLQFLLILYEFHTLHSNASHLPVSPYPPVAFETSQKKTKDQG